MIIYLFSEIYLIFVLCYSIFLLPMSPSAYGVQYPAPYSGPLAGNSSIDNNLSSVRASAPLGIVVNRWTMIWFILTTFLLTLGVPEWNRSIHMFNCFFSELGSASGHWEDTIGMSYHFSPYIIVVRSIILIIFCLYFFLPYYNYSYSLHSFSNIEPPFGSKELSPLHGESQINYLLIIILLSILIILSSYDLIMLYISMELLALSSYLLASRSTSPTGRGAAGEPLRSSDTTSSPGSIIEASLKYYIMGSISSAFYLLGTSLVYGVKGSINFKHLIDIEMNIDHTVNEIHHVGVVFIIFYFLFKLSIFPFHQWTPDVFQGVNLNITAFFAILSKSVFFFLLPYIIVNWVPLITEAESTLGINNILNPLSLLSSAPLGLLGIISILLGSFLGLLQSNIKRLLAYSSISNGGFMMLALSTNSFIGYNSFFFYLIIYLISSIGLFSSIQRPESRVNTIQDLKDLVKINPIFALNFTLILFSLAGIPPLAGFISKFQIFYSVSSSYMNLSVSQFIIIVFLALFLSLFAAFYYLRIVHFFYFWESASSSPTWAPDLITSYLLSGAGLLLIILGIYPYPLIEFSTFLTLCID